MTERTDRELMELAAKAAGITPDKSSTNGGGAGNTGFDILGNLVLDWHDGITWNPLDDDGDALRLAVRLNLLGAHSDEHAIGAAGMIDADPYAATRRAIVRAAAAMAEGGER